MKTATLFATTLILVTLMTSAKLNAQNEAGEITLCNSESCTAYSYHVSNNISENTENVDLSNGILLADEQGVTIPLTFVIPAHTYSATLLVQDFNGRDLKSLNIDPNATNAFEFSFNDLLSGNYNYTLLLNDQHKIYGQFVVKD